VREGGIVCETIAAAERSYSLTHVWRTAQRGRQAARHHDAEESF
jgi:hypothetical protein